MLEDGREFVQSFGGQGPFFESSLSKIACWDWDTLKEAWSFHCFNWVHMRCQERCALNKRTACLMLQMMHFVAVIVFPECAWGICLWWSSPSPEDTRTSCSSRLCAVFPHQVLSFTYHFIIIVITFVILHAVLRWHVHWFWYNHCLSEVLDLCMVQACASICHVI